MRKLALNLFSVLTVLWVLLNLTFWLLPFTLATLCKLILPRYASTWRVLISTIYHLAARVHSFWMLRVIGVRVHINGQFDSHSAPIVISNHQSWCDIPVIHHVITDFGPMVKFLIKRQLVWVPVVGWLCWMLGFPLLHRGLGQDARKKDYNTLRKFSREAKQDGSAILIFPEGTRYTAEKHRAQNSPFVGLLKPRMGGIRILKDALPPDTPIVDLTIVYEGGNCNAWECLHGVTKDIHVNVKQYRLGDVGNLSNWLAERWQEKEALLRRG